MEGGIGGFNGFIFRTRRTEDAQLFLDDQRQRSRRRGRPATALIAAVAVVVIALLTLGVIDMVG